MTGTVLIAHPSPDLYGSDRVLLESVSAFLEAGSRVVVALPTDGPLAAAIRDRGAEVEFCASPVLRKAYLSVPGLVRLFGLALASIPGSVRLLRRLRPRLVLVNTVTIPLWIVMARMLGVPVYCHVHEAEGTAKAWVRRLLYLPLLACTGLVVNSRFSLDVLVRTWPSLAGRSRVVYNGVPGPESPTPPRRVLPPKQNGDGSYFVSPPDEVRLLFLGRLSPRKGPHVAISALGRLVAAGVPARLSLLGAVFPGYEWYEAELRTQVEESGLGGRVDFLGFEPDIWSRLAASDIVVVPSVVDEPFGNTAVEAMLALRPLVVSATSGLREASAGYRTARRVEPDDPAAIADAVTELVASWPEVIAQADADRELAQQRHSARAYAEGLLAVFGDRLVVPAQTT